MSDSPTQSESLTKLESESLTKCESKSESLTKSEFLPNPVAPVAPVAPVYRGGNACMAKY